MTRNRRPLALLGVVISGVFLWIAFKDLKPGEVWGSIQHIKLAWLAAAAGVYFVAVVVIALRWQFLLRAVRPLPLRNLVPLVAIGYMGNNVYPFRSGEFLRIVLLQRKHAVPIARGTTTVLVERVFDGLVMLTFVIVPLLFIDVPSTEIRAVAVFAAPIFLGALAAFFVLAARPDLLRRVVIRFGGALPDLLRERVLNTGEDIIGGLEGLRNRANLAGAVISSYTTWAIEAGVYWMVSFAFDLNVSYPVMLMVVGAVNLAGLIPASPGQIGVFEFFVGIVLIAVNVPETQATAYALVVHVVIWLPVTLAGFAFLVREGLSLHAVAQARKLEHETPA